MFNNFRIFSKTWFLRIIFKAPVYIRKVALVVKNLPANTEVVRDADFIPGSERFPGGGKCTWFQRVKHVWTSEQHSFIISLLNKSICYTFINKFWILVTWLKIYMTKMYMQYVTSQYCKVVGEFQLK